MRRAGLFFLALLFTANTAAQVPPPQPDNPNSDITHIIRNILGETQIPFPNPPGADPLQSIGIENIPISITLPDSAEYEGEWLVVSAYAPPAPHRPNASGELLGETRLLLRGLTPPFNVIIAAPKAIISQLEHVKIRGKIENQNGEAVLVTAQEGYYRGFDPVSMVLSPKQTSLGAPPPDAITKIEQTRGQVSISNPGDMFRGSVLTVQLSETGLVGGNQNALKGEARLDIDGQRAPFKFTLDYGVPQNGFKMPLTLSAFITDWAGRKTHVMAKPLDFNGPNYDYRLQLDSFKQGQEVANFQYSNPETETQTKIRGQAVFNAYKGLARDSYLKIRLLSQLGPNGQPREISKTSLNLNGLSGNIDFTASAPSVNFDPELPAPLLDVSIVNASGNVVFDSQPRAVDAASMNFVTLSPRPLY